MQVAFVAYHYTNAQDVYVPIRWCVSAYVWLTGFGNGVYFWASADFSPKRFVQQIWRMVLRDTRDVLSGDLDAAGPALEASGAAVSIYDVARSVGASAHLSDPTRGRGASPPHPPVAPLKPPTKKLFVRNC